jgi:hypothetical protein
MHIPIVRFEMRDRYKGSILFGIGGLFICEHLFIDFVFAENSLNLDRRIFLGINIKSAYMSWRAPSGVCRQRSGGSNPARRPLSAFLMSLLFAIATACVILALLAGPVLRILAPALARR